VPWYSAEGSLDTLLIGRRDGLFYLVCYVRDGDTVFETYWTKRRGVEAMDNNYGLIDLTYTVVRSRGRIRRPAGSGYGALREITIRTASMVVPSPNGRESKPGTLTTFSKERGALETDGSNCDQQKALGRQRNQPLEGDARSADSSVSSTSRDLLRLVSWRAVSASESGTSANCSRSAPWTRIVAGMVTALLPAAGDPG
jgi:hypothetical protein